MAASIAESTSPSVVSGQQTSKQYVCCRRSKRALLHGHESQEIHLRYGNQFRLSTIKHKSGLSMALHYEHRVADTAVLSDLVAYLLERIENGKTGKFTWDLYDRLRRYEDDRLVVEFGYDALGRRVYKDSRSKYRNRVQAGPVWNENARRALDEKLGCDLTLFIWDGDTLAFEQRGREGKGRTTHYVFEPGTFVPVAQGVMNHIEEMLHQPRYAFPYDIDRDPIWQHKPTPKPFDTFGWYQCDQLGTPMEATGVSGQILWKGNYKALPAHHMAASIAEPTWPSEVGEQQTSKQYVCCRRSQLSSSSTLVYVG